MTTSSTNTIKKIISSEEEVQWTARMLDNLILIDPSVAELSDEDLYARQKEPRCSDGVKDLEMQTTLLKQTKEELLALCRDSL